MSKYNYTIYGLMYVAIFAFVGVFNFSVAQFDTDILSQTSYWISTGTTSLTYVFAFQVSVWLSADIMTNTHELYLELNTDINKFSKTKIEGNFEIYIRDEINWKNKQQAWKKLKQAELKTWSRKIRPKVLENSRLPREQWTEQTRKYFQKKERIEEQLQQSWMDENLPYRKVKYPETSPQEIITGEEKPYSNKKLIDGSITTYALGKRILLLGITIFFNAIFSTMFLTGSIYNIGIIITIVFQLVMIGANIATGWMNGIDGFKKKRLTSARLRYDILLQYNEWKKKRVSLQSGKEVEGRSPDTDELQ